MTAPDGGDDDLHLYGLGNAGSQTRRHQCAPDRDDAHQEERAGPGVVDDQRVEQDDVLRLRRLWRRSDGNGSGGATRSSTPTICAATSSPRRTPTWAWIYIYDALGELMTQSDPNERAAGPAITTLSYDGLGAAAPARRADQTSVWTYDTATHGAGLLASATGSNAAYRPHAPLRQPEPSTKVTLAINAKNYIYNRTYNSDSRIATLTYPSGLVVQYVYTPLGYLSQLKDNATGRCCGSPIRATPRLHLTDQLAGNGVDTIQVFDPLTGLVQQIRASADGSDDGHTANFSYQFDRIGNLKNRADNYGATENFCYDKLNRLINYAAGGPTCLIGATGLVKSVAYDDTGNITNNPTWPTAAAAPAPIPTPIPAIRCRMRSSRSAARRTGSPIPATATTPTATSPASTPAPTARMARSPRRPTPYWSFNMAHTIAEGSTSLTLTYDSEHTRVTQALTTASTTTTTTYLNDPISGAIAEKVATGSTNTWNDYLMVDGRLIGERTCTRRGAELHKRRDLAVLRARSPGIGRGGDGRHCRRHRPRKLRRLGQAAQRGRRQTTRPAPTDSRRPRRGGSRARKRSRRCVSSTSTPASTIPRSAGSWRRTRSSPTPTTDRATTDTPTPTTGRSRSQIRRA